MACLSSGPSHALGPEYALAFKAQIRFILATEPVYVWGGADITGVDCSGMLGLAGQRAGMPVKRSTSRRMAFGFDGWVGVAIPLPDAGDLDLGFFTFKESRPYGHVGAFWHDEHNKGLTPDVVHASPSRKKVVRDPLRYLQKNLTKVRRLTIGD